MPTPATASKAHASVPVVMPATADKATARLPPAASCPMSTKLNPGMTSTAQCTTAIASSEESME
jgi:hypothetical protein